MLVKHQGKGEQAEQLMWKLCQGVQPGKGLEEKEE